METNDKNLEQFVDKLMKYDALEQPSADFADAIMSKISIASTSQITKYTPLIPKFVWWLIAVVLAGVIVYVFKENPQSKYSLFELLPEQITLPKFNLFENLGVSFSEISVYAVVFLAIMLCVQIPILKNYMDKRLEL